ncbi:hypothetical protein MNB_SV-6-1103 [hydrothermal vent metagenome]|uniref:Uncharacterized protein n=1 Tax=hydrothermal vent metagenome TaxID=652676 RepID=A0A1W1BZK0_9ZZZZ
MKGLIIIGILITFGLIALNFYRTKGWKKLSISLAIFTIVLIFVGLSPMVRTVVPIFIAHLLLIVIAWGGVLYYIFRTKLYLPVILSPLATIALFLIMERVIGSGNP